MKKILAVVLTAALLQNAVAAMAQSIWQLDQQFSQFSGSLAGLARQAFANRWIDAQPRAGKRGGAFCMWVPGVRESRVLCNFDGSLDQLFTIAHELGHAYHNFNLRGKQPLEAGAL